MSGVFIIRLKGESQERRVQVRHSTGTSFNVYPGFHNLKDVGYYAPIRTEKACGQRKEGDDFIVASVKKLRKWALYSEYYDSVDRDKRAQLSFNEVRASAKKTEQIQGFAADDKGIFDAFMDIAKDYDSLREFKSALKNPKNREKLSRHYDVFEPL